MSAIIRILVSHQVLQTLARLAILCHAGSYMTGSFMTVSYMTVYVQSLTSLPADAACRRALPNELSIGL